MYQIYSACLSISCIDGEAVSLSVHSTHRVGDDVRHEDYQLTLDATQPVDDLRDWLRQALAEAVEAI